MATHGMQNGGGDGLAIALEQQQQQDDGGVLEADLLVPRAELVGPAVEGGSEEGQQPAAAPWADTPEGLLEDLEGSPRLINFAFVEDGGEGAEDEPTWAQKSEEEEGEDGQSPSHAAMTERLRWLMMNAGEGGGIVEPEAEARAPLLPSFDLEGVAQYIHSGGARRIICMCGAGISVSAGIPDFRSPGSGLYHRLEAYDLPYPQAVFEIDFFQDNPRPFFLLAKELFPGNFNPTPAHYFMRLLYEKDLLLRCFTQNIDSLEHQAGLPREAVVAAHGNFDSARCVRCGRPHSVAHVRRAVFAGEGNPCYCLQQGCGGLVKPDIVFFGESLPPRFFHCMATDFPQADLLIVMGTSLVVQPFASLIDRVRDDTPRLLINRERAGEGDPLLRVLGLGGGGFTFDRGNYRDALFLGDCDEGVRRLCRLLGWEGELDALIAAGPAPRDSEASEAPQGPPRRIWRMLPGAGKASRRERRRRELHALHRALSRAQQAQQTLRRQEGQQEKEAVAGPSRGPSSSSRGSSAPSDAPSPGDDSSSNSSELDDGMPPDMLAAAGPKAAAPLGTAGSTATASGPGGGAGSSTSTGARGPARAGWLLPTGRRGRRLVEIQMLRGIRAQQAQRRRRSMLRLLRQLQQWQL